jgi:hypothetical protein
LLQGGDSAVAQADQHQDCCDEAGGGAGDRGERGRDDKGARIHDSKSIADEPDDPSFTVPAAYVSVRLVTQSV